MSIRISADKTALRRTTSLPSSHAAFTLCGCFKVVNASSTRTATLFYTQNPPATHAEMLQLSGATGLVLRASDSYNARFSPDVATVPTGGATGENWFFGALVGTASGAGGLRAYYKPIGSGSLTFQSVLNSPGTDGFEAIQIGDTPYGTTNWFDGLVAHVKVYNRALSDAELTAEAGQGAPVTTSGLLSYHSFSNSTLATALIPDQGSGTFSVFTSNPATNTDMPVFAAAPTLTLTDTLPATSGVTRPGAPTITTATVLSARTVQVSWSASTGTVTGYRVYAQRTGEQPFVIGTTTSALTVTGTGLNPAVGYTITVRAFNSAGESDPSAGLSITTRRVLARMSKVEETISGELSVRMLLWQTGTGGNIVGGFLGETGNLTIGPPTFDVVEAANVCTVTADISAMTPPPLNIVGSNVTPGVVLPAGLGLSAGASVVAMLGKTSTSRWTGIEAVTIVEEP